MSAPWRVGLLKHTAGRHSICSPSPLPYPGLILLLVCRQTLEYTRVNDNFISRTEYPAGYAFAMWTLAAGVSLLAVWLLLLTMDALDLTHFSFLPALLEVGVLVALSGVVLGGLLDYLALRKTHLT